MNRPKNDEVMTAFAHLRGNRHFESIIGWFRDELNACDRANRIVGAENKTSAAHALGHILELYEAAKNPPVPAADNGGNEHLVKPGYEGAG